MFREGRKVGFILTSGLVVLTSEYFQHETSDAHEIFVNYVPNRRYGLPKDDQRRQPYNNNDYHNQQYQDNQADDPLWLRENEYYSDEDNYNSDQNDEYIFIDR